ncbi:hypothetical protein HDU91_000720, partial [Kappamyces sp. JEL0680]
MLRYLGLAALFTQTNAKASVCSTSSTSQCASDGSSNYISRSLTYDTNTGKFSGQIVTNNCPDFIYGNYTSTTTKGGSFPTCTTVNIPQYNSMPTAAPLRGSIGYGITSGINIYGPMDNGFSL